MAGEGRGSGGPRPGSLDWELLAPTLGPGAPRLLACSGASTSASSLAGDGGVDRRRNVGGAPGTERGSQGSGGSSIPLLDGQADPRPSAEMLELIRRGRYVEALLTPPAQALLHWPAGQEAHTPLLPPQQENNHREPEATGAGGSVGNGMQEAMHGDSEERGGGAEAAGGVERD